MFRDDTEDEITIIDEDDGDVVVIEDDSEIEEIVVIEDDSEIEEIIIEDSEDINLTGTGILGEDIIIDDYDDDDVTILELLEEESSDEASVESTNLLESGLDEEFMVKAKRETSLKILENSTKYSLERFVDYNNCLKVKTNIALEHTNLTKHMADINYQLSETAPEFLDIQQASKARKNIAVFDGTIETSNVIFNAVVTDDWDKTDVNRYIFFKYLKNMKKSIDISNTNKQMSKLVELSQLMSFMRRVFADQPMAGIESAKEWVKKDKCLLEHLTINNNRFRFTCGDCHSETSMEGVAVSIMKLIDIYPICTPMVCSSCGKVNLIPSTMVKNLVKITKPRVLATEPFGEVNNLSKPVFYYPSKDELIMALGNLVSFDVLKQNGVDPNEVSIEDYVQDFMDLIDIFHKRSIMDDDTSLTIKELAKILGSIGNNYEELKERAIGSLIHELRQTPLFKISKEHYESVMIPYYYKDKVMDYKNEIALKIQSRCIDKETKDFDDEMFIADYNSYCREMEELKSYIERSIKGIYENIELFGHLPISNINLHQEDIDAYLSSKELRDVIDEVSDYMIVYSTAETFFNGYRAKVFKNGVSSSDLKYDYIIRGLNDPSSLSRIGLYTSKLSNYFAKKYKKPKEGESEDSLSLPRTFLVNYTTDYTFFEYVSKFSISMIKGDYYEARKVANNIIDNYKGTLNMLRVHPVKSYSRIGDLIENLPYRDVAMDKFSYYFKGYNMSKEEQGKILDIYNSKGVVPRKLKGDTFDDMLKYYSETKYFHPNELLIDIDMDEYYEKNEIEIISLKYLDCSISFRSFINYSIGIDLMLSMVGQPKDVICKCFNLNDAIVSIYLDSVFNIPEGSISPAVLAKELIYNNKVISDILKDEEMSDIVKISMLKNESDEVWEELNFSDRLKEVMVDYMDMFRDNDNSTT